MTDQTNVASPAKPRRFSPIAVTVVLVVVLIIAFLAASTVVGEVMWYDQLGFLPVLATQWIAASVMFVIGFLGMSIPLFFAIDLAYRKRPVYARLTAQLDRYQEIVEPLRRLIKWALPAVFGIFAGLASATQWQNFLLWLNAEPTGTTDPQFGLDISFYLFTLPVIQSVLAFASAVTLISLLAGAATSYLYGGIAFTGRDARISKATRIQAAVFAALYLLIQGVSLWIDQYLTLTDDTGLFTGGTFSAVNAVIPGKQILAGIAIIVAVLFIVTSITGKWRLPVIGTVLFLVSSLVLGVGYPWAVQQFQVTPDEKSLESEYLERNIEATREAYGISDVEIERYDAVTTAEPGALRDDAVATSNIRIIDPEVVSATFSQLEQSRQYYQFPQSLNVDRYVIDGEVVDTVSAVRDINIESQNGWYNRTLVYTHGYGLVAAYGNQRSAGGEPVFLENGIPTSGKLGEFEPRIYFGMDSPTYSIVGGERDKPIELDYPADDETAENDTVAPAVAEAEEVAEDQANSQVDEVVETEAGRQNLTTFTGNGGPVLSNLFTKLVYALKFQDMEVLLSTAVVDGSQIIYDRNPVERLQKVAPYLTIDSSPYASVVDGKVVWILDGYTTSDKYPYSDINDFNALKVDADNPRTSQLPDNMNYIRNSVKATVDAYDGSVTLYAWDTEDPILKAWSNIFPTALSPISEMSGDLLSHVRYPSDLFKAQRELLSTYHVTDAGAFYSDEDAWRTPNDPVSTTTTGVEPARQPPYYLTLSAGEGAAPNYSIYSTYIPAANSSGSRDILTGYLAANANAGSADGKVSEDYGTLKLLTLPKGNSVPGPGQVQNSFTTDSQVSNLLNILRQGESEVISGNLLTLPLGGGLLYVQPVYVQATSGTSFPILQKVLVSFGDEIAFEDTLDQALDALFGGNSGASAGDGGTQTETDESGNDESGEAGSPPASSTQSAEMQAALSNMKQAIADREAALKSGDWAAYGDADQRLLEALEQALKAE